jgi:molybdenum cofactor cytidylyltransferase
MRDTGALILAAGGSTRFGAPKQFLELDGETLIRRIAKAALDAKCHPIVVVAGDAADRIRSEVNDLPVEVIENTDWQRGIGTSIKRGLAQIRAAASGGRCSVIAGHRDIEGSDDGASPSRIKLDALVILTCDQPFVSAQTIRQLAAGTQPIAASGYAGTVGVPALFRRKYFAALGSLPDKSGAKSLIDAHRSDVAVVPFPEGAIDIDTPADYAAISRRLPS